MLYEDNITVINKNLNIESLSFEDLKSPFSLDLAALKNKGLKLSIEDFLSVDFLKWFEYVKLLESQGIKKMLFFDFETSSMNGYALSMGAILLDLDKNEEIEFYSLFNPLCAIDKEASKIHGIYEKDIMNAPKFVDKAQEIIDLINKADILIAFNAIYDISVLVREFERFNLSLPNIKFLDLMTRSKKIINAKNSLGRLKNPSLSEFAAFVGEKYEENKLHNSLYDTRIMLNSFKKFVNIT